MLGIFALNRVMDLLRPFGGAPIPVKDYVKSRKHEWADAEVEYARPAQEREDHLNGQGR
jgi:hypothetical protein